MHCKFIRHACGANLHALRHPPEIFESFERTGRNFKSAKLLDQFDRCASTSGEGMGTASSTPTEYVPMSEAASVWPQRTRP